MSEGYDQSQYNATVSQYLTAYSILDLYAFISLFLFN